jgi:hypothetical protein
MGLLDGINPISWVTEGIKAISGIIDDVSTTDEERLQATAKLKQIEDVFNTKALEYEARIAQTQSEVIIAEAKGNGWLQNNWRPSLMAVFGIIIANNYILAPYLTAMFSWEVVLDIPADLWDLLKLGVGGYIGGRSVEKVVKVWKEKSA